MEIKELVEKVLNSPIFQYWDKKDNYLVNCSFIDGKWQVHFYSKKTRKITSFTADEEVTLSEDKVFQAEKKDIDKLEIDKVKVGLDDALEMIDKIKEEKIPTEDVSNSVIILQQDKHPIWNITRITSGFHLLNVKINAINKEIISEDSSSVFQLREKSDS